MPHQVILSYLGKRSKNAVLTEKEENIITDSDSESLKIII